MPRRPPRPHHRRAIGILWIAACGVVAGRVEAFFPTNLRTLERIQGHSHEAITTEALEALDAERFGAQQPTDSMRAANDAIVAGNVHVDDDQVHSALHFDGENFFAGQARLLGIKEIVIASIQQNDVQGARNELGQALHSIQDFYAHSNWTNNNGGVNPDLGVTDHQLQNTLGINDPAEVNGQLTTLLTSGYYHDEDRSPPTSITKGHKDRHGGLTDKLSAIDFGLGLNRDSNNPEFSPEALKHELAANLAQQATKKYINEILDQLTPKQVALLLGRSRTFGIVIDTTNSMGPEIASVKNRATQLVDARVGTSSEPSRYVLGQILDPETPAPLVTTDADAFKAAIAALTPRPQAVDCPELAMAGTMSALGAMEEGGELFVWTDASAKDAALAGAVSALAQSKHIDVIYMLSGSCSPIDPAYVRVANESGGRVFVVTEAQVDAAGAALPALARGATSVDLLSVRDAVASGSKDYAVPIDSTLTEVTFSADTDAMEVRRPPPNAQLVQAGDPDATVVQLAGGTQIATSAFTSGTTVVHVTSPAAGTWTVTIGVSATYRLAVSGSSTLDLTRFRFVQDGGRDGHESVVPIPGLPVGGTAATAETLLTGVFSSPQFDLRRPDGTHLQDVTLAAVLDGPTGQFAGAITLPDEPFLAYVTGQDGGGHAFQRVARDLFQPQSVSIAVPLRQDLHAGLPTTYVFSVRNAGAAGTFDLTATDANGFVTSATPSQANVGAGASADFTVILQPPADVATGTSDALTVRATSTGTPGLENFAALTSVVVPVPTTTTPTTVTTTTTTTATTTTPTTVTPTTVTTKTSTTTLPCTTPRCTIDAALHGQACGDETVPRSITKRLDRGTTLLDRADQHPKSAKRLHRQVKHVLRSAGKVAGKAAKGKKPKLSAECALAIQHAIAAVVAGL
jgi:von Willebrand factor A domain-containing protein 7